jgi:phytoene synthase
VAPASLLSPLGETVRRHDPDRYYCTLFAPPARRETLFVLYAFNHELARAREVVREPFAALIRLQWWREVVEGARRRHDVAGPLGAALDAGALQPSTLAGMIEAREAETEPIETLEAFLAYAEGSAGGLMVAAAQALGMENAGQLRPWGGAYGVAGMLRSIPALARHGRCILPRSLLAQAGLTEGQLLAQPDTPALQPVRSQLAAIARNWAETPVAIPRPALAAALPVVFARKDLARPPAPAGQPWRRSVADRSRVAWAALRGAL